MKHPSSNRRAAVVAMLLVMMLSQGTAVPEDAGARQAAVGRQGGESLSAGSQEVSPTYYAAFLSLARSVYADLQRARRAALDREAMGLRLALDEARGSLHRLLRPPAVMALHTQLQSLRSNLKDRRAGLDDDLWVPVEAEINDVLMSAPDDIKTKAAEAVRRGRAAARAGDWAAASKQLDIITTSLQYGLGMFPLPKVEQNLDSAWASAILREPDWAGALEAVQSALATFHWYTRNSAHGLLAAYDQVVSAYVLATGPHFRSDQEQQVVDYLAKAEAELATTPGGRRLAEEARGLVDKVKPSWSEIKQLLQDIHSEIEYERQRAEERYWDAIASG